MSKKQSIKDKKLQASKAKKAKENRQAYSPEKLAIDPTANAASITQYYGSIFGDLDISCLYNRMEQAKKDGGKTDLQRSEAMLIEQAQALQSIFTGLARKAYNQQYLTHFESFLKLALKAQSQCRATLETLANIKNPPFILAKQANIAHGHQQVNNGACSSPEPISQGSRAEKNNSDQNELLEAQHENGLDTGKAKATGRNDQAMEAMAEVNRAKE